jgi:galactoside O-acetyltransferase
MSTCDDWSGCSLVGPQTPDDLKPLLQKERVVIRRHVLLGANCTVLPGVVIGEGCSVGANTLVKKDLDPWGIYAGSPPRRIGERSREILNLEERYLERWRKASIA